MPKLQTFWKKNWGRWSYFKITISTKSLMSIPFGQFFKERGGVHHNQKLLSYFLLKGVVYVQIIRWSKSLCMITEAQDNLRDFWICKSCQKYWYLWLGTKIKYMFFLLMFLHVQFHLALLSTNVTGVTSLRCFFMCKRLVKHIKVKCVENISRENIESPNTSI